MLYALDKKDFNTHNENYQCTSGKHHGWKKYIQIRVISVFEIGTFILIYLFIQQWLNHDRRVKMITHNLNISHTTSRSRCDYVVVFSHYSAQTVICISRHEYTLQTAALLIVNLRITMETYNLWIILPVVSGQRWCGIPYVRMGTGK